MSMLSIITINRNNADGLRKTIESVVTQNYDNFEYIIIDGASTDGSVDIIKEYAGHPVYGKKISYWISEPDTGIYNAMNKGIQKARETYALFLNSGDYFVSPSVLSDAVPYLTADIVCGRLQVNLKDASFGCVFPPEDISLSVFYKRSLAHQASFIKNALFMQYGLYDENLRCASDWKFFFDTLFIGTASYRAMPVLITNFDGTGVSSVNPDMNIQEMENYLKQHISEKILYDYEKIRSYENTAEYDILQRTVRNARLYGLIKGIFKMRDLLKGR